MKKTILLNLIEKAFDEKTYKKAREKEKEFSQDEFTAYYLPRTIVLWFIISVMLLLSLVAFKLARVENIVIITLAIGILGSFLVSIYHITYRCFVNDEGMQITYFWFIKKQVLWKDMYKVEIKRWHEEFDKAEERNIIIRNKNKKIIFSCSFNLVGFTLIAKKAKKERKKPH